jgi:hypothetical protein
MDTIFDGEVPRARLALRLRYFSELKDNREPWRIVYPLQEPGAREEADCRSGEPSPPDRSPKAVSARCGRRRPPNPAG